MQKDGYACDHCQKNADTHRLLSERWIEVRFMGFSSNGGEKTCHYCTLKCLIADMLKKQGVIEK